MKQGCRVVYADNNAKKYFDSGNAKKAIINTACPSRAKYLSGLRKLAIKNCQCSMKAVN